ncbi:hypothetical protein ACFYWY_28680 [Streptomyces sp. NPDC002870]|uniref:hypothetical protein n=1 Tax=Streptomyces sp. NPDC002870 TaxID=3364666 RepID=UPI0036C6C6E1
MTPARGAGSGYFGSTLTYVICASFTFVFLALEGSITAQAMAAWTQTVWIIRGPEPARRDASRRVRPSFLSLCVNPYPLSEGQA